MNAPTPDPPVGKRVRLITFCGQCYQRVTGIMRKGNGPMQFDPCGDTDLSNADLKVEPLPSGPADPDPQEGP